MAIFTCKDCKDRTIGCHSTCKKYIKEKAEYESNLHQYNVGRENDKYRYAKVVEKRSKQLRKYGRANV